MKKMVAMLMVTIMLMLCAAPVVEAAAGRGGPMGFIAGCCFGMRAGGAYNDGKDIVWREWIMIIPVVSFFVAIWNGIDGFNGVTTSDYAQQYGSMYF